MSLKAGNALAAIPWTPAAVSASPFHFCQPEWATNRPVAARPGRLRMKVRSATRCPHVEGRMPAAPAGYGRP